IRGKANPIIPMTLVPAIGVFILGYGFEDLADFYESGLGSVMSVVVMFIFAIIFCGMLQDIGLFTPVIKSLIVAYRGNVMLVHLGTAGIGCVAPLVGSASTTCLLTIPALLPLYRAMNMSRYVLLTIVAMAASVINMVPWAGPLGRAGTVIAQDPNDIWIHLIPIQAVAAVLVLGIAAVLGWSEKRRIAKLQESGEFEGSTEVDVAALAAEFQARQDQQQEEGAYHFRKGRAITFVNIVLAL